MSYDMYRYWLERANEYEQLKQARERGLREYAHSRKPQGVALVKRDPKADADFVAAGLIADDQMVNEYEMMRQRAVQNATMYGIGALLEAQRSNQPGLIRPALVPPQVEGR